METALHAFMLAWAHFPVLATWHKTPGRSSPSPFYIPGVCPQLSAPWWEPGAGSGWWPWPVNFRGSTSPSEPLWTGTALAWAWAPAHPAGFCETRAGGLGIRSAGPGSVFSVPDGRLALVAAGCFRGSRELEYNHEEADGFLRWVCQRTGGKPLENQKLQEIEAATKTKPIIKC